MPWKFSSRSPPSSDQAKARRLHIVIIIAWISIVAASATGLFRRERRHGEAEMALAAAYDDMERQVEARTAELSNANLKLREEIVDRQLTETSLIIERGGVQEAFGAVPDPPRHDPGLHHPHLAGPEGDVGEQGRTRPVPVRPGRAPLL